MGYRIIGTGSALPSRRVTNDDLAAFLDTSDEWIRQRTGIAARHVCTTETLDDLAAQASLAALDMAGLSAADLDLVVCSTTSTDHVMPGEGCAVAARLGATCPALDVSAGCAGFVFALDVADGLMATHHARRALVIGAERYSRLLDWSDRSTCVLFGDGAAAAVVEPAEGTVLAASLSTRPNVEALEVGGLPGASPFEPQPQPRPVLSMQGHAVYKFGVTSIVRAVRGLAKEARLDPAGIDHYVFHQANARIIDAAAARLGLEPSRVAHTLAETGNISSACIPYALDQLVRAGQVRAGETVALVGFGAGLSVGSCLLRWDEASAGARPPGGPAQPAPSPSDGLGTGQP